jgi:hypothetical protein
MSEDKPKKRGRPKKQPVDKIPSLSADNSVKITVNEPQELLKVQALIKDALKDVIKEDSKRIDKDKAVEAMTVTCSEFMKSFIIMGYDMENNAIQPIFYARNDLEADALSHYMQQYFMASMKEMR